ncbi:hypothetical protein FEM48_Zijuj09G0156600 [Ziziphus jujuba var. spinosa]|uniref:Uncharacterized protein n=1 Tax=Ziziphus jujuba var. spinosa TaxID=714518 RepID=A0A978UTU8_ZIZJJ|nr:hypothetical protein FEM48_Zijuj09G0156600 [Ziziphus jujuba var. spinosa]
MAAYHVRSNSFPSRPHPLVPEFNEQLCRLRASGSAFSSTSTSMACKLSGLRNLHDCVDRLLLLPLNQQALSLEKHEKWVDQIVDGSLKLLDICSIVKDALSQTKESTQKLQSIIRRRRGGEMVLSIEVNKFLSSRKVVKKAINKAIKNLKEKENKCTFNPLNKDNETVAIVNLLREAEAITLGVLESLLLFISEPKSGPKHSGWSFISNILQPKRMEEESKSNEFANAEAALHLLICQKMKKSSDSLSVENAQNQLGKMDLCIQDLEEGEKHSKTQGWSVVSKLLHQKGVKSEEDERKNNEFSKATAALQLIVG